MSRSIDEKNIEGFNNAAVLYRNLLRQHIEKENKVLFIMADKVISESEQDLMFEYFQQYEEKVIGPGVHEKLHAMIDTWSQAFEFE
jgi:hemerythrin-like domain-containing protein